MLTTPIIKNNITINQLKISMCLPPSTLDFSFSHSRNVSSVTSKICLSIKISFWAYPASPLSWPHWKLSLHAHWQNSLSWFLTRTPSVRQQIVCLIYGVHVDAQFTGQTPHARQSIAKWPFLLRPHQHQRCDRAYRCSEEFRWTYLPLLSVI